MAQMLAVTAPNWVEPSGYEQTKTARPEVSKPKHVLFKVYAASINPVDVKKANGAMKLIFKDKFPYKIGYDAAGVVEEVGTEVTKFKAGDKVYVRLPENERGSWAEYAMCEERFLSLKPDNISLNEAASIPLAGLTAYQALKNYRGSLEGKTVFVPAGLGGTGAYAAQLAKNVFKAGKVITTVSTTKVPKVPEYLGQGVVDQVIDYTKVDPKSSIPKESVDFLFDTTGQTKDFLHLMVPKTSSIVSISTVPSATTMQNSQSMREHPDKPTVPFAAKLFLNGTDALLRFRAGRYGVDYKYIFMDPIGSELEELKGFVEQGKLKPVVGQTVDFHDLAKVKEAATATFSGKGVMGKTVFEVVPEAQ